jgi:hypothetical protein
MRTTVIKSSLTALAGSEVEVAMNFPFGDDIIS